MERTLIAFAVLLAAASAAAERDTGTEGLYREGEPATLTPPPRATPKAAPAIDTSALQRRRPRVLVYWHRQLGDRISDTQVEELRVSSAGVRPRDNYEQVTRHTFRTGPDQAYSLLAPASAAEFEAAFHSTLRSHGIRIIDRSLAVRLVGQAESADGKSAHELNFQNVEMKALARHADYLAEVNFLEDPTSRTGTESRVKLIDVTTGEVVVDVVPSDLYKEGEAAVSAEAGRWIASDRGFVQESASQAKRPTRSEEGRTVALAVLRDLVAQDGSASAAP